MNRTGSADPPSSGPAQRRPPSSGSGGGDSASSRPPPPGDSPSSGTDGETPTSVGTSNGGGSGGTSTSTNAHNAANAQNSVSSIPELKLPFPLNLLSRAVAIFTILLRVALWPLGRLSRTLFPPGEYDGTGNTAACDRGARAFTSYFRERVRATQLLRPPNTTNDSQGQQAAAGETACPFVTRGYTATLSDIRALAPRSPLLLVYLRSPLHRDGDAFVDKFLCHGRTLEFLNRSSDGGMVTCFGASVHTADGARIRDMLDVTSFPFIALLSVKDATRSGNRNNNATAAENVTMELLLRMEGPELLKLSCGQFATYLTSAISRHGEILAEAEARRFAREAEVRLRAEQDAEFQEALLADQIREVAQQEAVEAERRAVQEAEEGERQEEERVRRTLEEAKEKAGVEPPQGTEGACRLRLTLPNGKKIDRRFRGTDTVDVVRAFLVVHFHEGEVGITNFGLSTSYPRKTFGEEDWGLSLVEAGLCPQAVVMVQDLDA